MLADNGKHVRNRHNYHMTLAEFKTLARFVSNNCNTQYYVMIMTHFLMGLRASEVCSINLLDFSDSFRKLTYRSAKTNEIFYYQPVPEPLAMLIKDYINVEGYRMRNGFLFGRYNKTGNKPICAKGYESWFAKIRKKICLSCPNFKDHYLINTKKGKTQKRYRIGTHSLRRLHRTTLRNSVDDIYLVKEICGYKDFSAFERYLNIENIHKKKEEIINAVFNPIIKDMFTGNSEQKRLNLYNF